MRGAVANPRERVIHGYPASALEVKKNVVFGSLIFI